MGRPGNEAICEEVESTERGSIEVTGGCSLLQLQKNEVGRLMNKTMSSDPNHQQVTVYYIGNTVEPLYNGHLLGPTFCPL